MTRTIRTLAPGLAAAGLIAALAGPASAETVTGIEESFGGYTVTVPSVELTNARIDAPTVRTFFGLGPTFLQARMFTEIVADGITIPELRVEGTFGLPGALAGGVAEGQLILRDIELKNLGDGIVGRLNVGSVGYYLDGFTAETGAVAASQVDAGFLFKLLGIGKGPAIGVESLFGDFSVAELNVSGADWNCSVGKVAMGAVALRALRRTSLPALAAFRPVSNDDYAQLMSFYADIVSAVAAEGFTIEDGLCEVTADDAGNIAFDRLATGETRPGATPYLEVEGFHATDKDGTLDVTKVTLAAIRYQSAMDAYEALGDAPATAAWAAEQGRALWLQPGGIELSGIATEGMALNLMGRPAPATIGKIRLDIGGYVDGIPKALTLQIEDAAFAGRDDAEDTRVAEILGSNDLDVDISFQTVWNEARQAIPFALNVAVNDTAKLGLTVWLGHAHEAMFSEETARFTAAMSALTFLSGNLEIADPGLILYAFDALAQQIRIDPVLFRNQLIDQTRDVIAQRLRPEQDPLSISEPIVAFLGGAPRLSISATSAVAGGLRLAPLIGPGKDWTVILPYLNLTATSQPTLDDN